MVIWPAAAAMATMIPFAAREVIGFSDCP